MRRGFAPNPTRGFVGPRRPTPPPRGAHYRAPWRRGFRLQALRVRVLWVRVLFGFGL